MADINSSINNLIGTFATLETGSYSLVPDKLVCIDTSNNRIGVNTIDPSYGIHVMGDSSSGTISSCGLRVSNNSNTVVVFDNLPAYSDSLELGQLYIDNGLLKIKS